MAAARLEVERFSGRNDFGLWRIKMRAMLIQQGLGDAIKADGDKGKAADAVDEKVLMKKQEINEKAHSVIILCLADNVLREVAKEATAAGIWAKLESLYMTKSLANRLFMKQKLYSYKFLEERTISEQLDEFNKAVDDLENIDVKLEDEDKAIILLNALPKTFDHLRDAMLYGRENTITLEEAQCALRSKELRKINASQESSSQALNVNKFKGKKKFNGAQKSQNQKHKDVAGKETRSCHYCKKPGHLKKDCFSWKRKQNEEKAGPSQADLAEETDTAQILNITDKGIEKSWIMDSGCSFHICSNREWFEDLVEARGSVMLGNDQTCSIEGVGNIRLKVHDGSVKLLTQVRFIPVIKRNLISLGMLESKGFKFCSEDGCMTVSINGKNVMIAERKNSLYYLVADTVVGCLNIAEKAGLDLWHKRLGHIGDSGIMELVKKGIISTDAVQRPSRCEHCILGKSKKLPFKAGKHTSKAGLDYAHCDLWGPTQPVTMGGGKYFMSIIDDYSRKVWVYILKEKSQAFDKFREWCQEMKLKKGTVLKCLRTDNGLEFLSNDFESFCKKNGIQRHRTVPANPQQNGVAERMNRTLLERVRCMLLSSGLPKTFWGEAVSTAATLINRSPSSAIKNEVPDARWYGENGSYTQLRVFGCRAYAHCKQGKLDPRAMKCIMVGYQHGVKGYRLWCTEKGKQKIIISRDVIFAEDQMPYLNSNDGAESEKAVIIEQPDIWEPEKAQDTEDEIAYDGSSDQGGGTDLQHSEPESENESSYMLARDRIRREVRKPSRFNDYEMSFFALCVAEIIEHFEPASYSEALNGKEKAE